jgi:hypothetical protein
MALGSGVLQGLEIQDQLSAHAQSCHRNPGDYCMIDQVASNKSSLLLKDISQNAQTLQLFAMNIKTEIIYKSYLKYQSARLG